MPKRLRKPVYFNHKLVTDRHTFKHNFRLPTSARHACMIMSFTLRCSAMITIGMLIQLSHAGGLVPTGSPRPPWVLIEEKLSKQQGDEK